MKIVHYFETPSKRRWKSDSKDPSILVHRSRDRVLIRIDNLVEAIGKTQDGGEELYLLHELFFAINYWLSNFSHNPTMSKAREPAMRALFAYVANMLCSTLGCTVNVLPRELENAYGRELTQHGKRVDHAECCARYLTRAEAAKYKLIFKNGVAWMSNWDEKGAQPRLKKAQSEIAYDLTLNNTKTLQQGFANCVMSMGREIFMANHLTSMKEGTRQGFFHSSYLAGLPTQYAGSILIVDGKVQGIQCNSGHYKTTDMHTVNMLEHLMTLGVSLSEVDVYNFKGAAFTSQTHRTTGQQDYIWAKSFSGRATKDKAQDTVIAEKKAAYTRVYDAVQAKGMEYLRCHGNWDSVLKRHGLNLDNFHELRNPRNMLNRLKSQQVTVLELIQERVEETKLANRAMGMPFKVSDIDAWQDAYKEVCKDLSLVDPAWAQKWKKPPPAMPVAPVQQQARRPPPRPATKPPPRPRRRPVTS